MASAGLVGLGSRHRGPIAIAVLSGPRPDLEAVETDA
jgi:hypothetical protein